MPKQRKIKKLKVSIKEKYSYDFEEIREIIEAMDFLRKDSVKSGIPEITTMVDETHRILATVYHSLIGHRKLPEIEPLEFSEIENYIPDMSRMERIVTALDCLRKCAIETGAPEVSVIIDSAFKLVLTSYYCIMRYDMVNLASAESEQ